MFSHLFSRFPLRFLFMFIIMLPLLSLGRHQTLSATPTALVTQDLNSSLTAYDLAEKLGGPGIAVSNVTYTGSNRAAGTFSGGSGIVGFEEGIILSSGDIASVVGPNSDDATSNDNAQPGDRDLDTVSGFTTRDAAVLEFDFVPNWDHLYFQFVFASEEYNEYVDSAFNDTFAFFVNGQNCALAQGSPITVNKINNGNPFGSTPNSNPSLYINNDLSDGDGPINTQMDGLTKILTCASDVVPNETNHIKLAIADASDLVLDTNVFIEANSFSTEPPNIDLTPQTDSLCIPDEHTVTASLNDNEGNAVENVSVNFEVISGPHAGTSSTGKTNANGEATFTYSGTITGTDTIEADFKDALGNTITSSPASMGWLPAEDCLPPEDAIDLHAMASEESVNLSWDLVAPLLGDLDHYEVFRTPDGSSIHSTTNSQQTDNDVTSDVEYCYQIKAFDDENKLIGSSNEACATVGSLTIWVPHQTVQPNATNVPVAVNLANGNGLCPRTFDIKIDYDATKVQATGTVSPTIYTQGYAFQGNATVPGEVKISAIIGGDACQELFGGGTVFDISFDAIGNEGDVSTLEFLEGLSATVIYDEDNLITPVPLIHQDGSLTIGFTFIRGDINGDGIVNAADAALVLDIASGKLIPTGEQKAACDVNGDNACNAADSTLILCYAAFQDWGQCGGVESSNRHAARVNPDAPVQVNIGQPSQSGQNATFPVSVSNAADLSGADFTFAYDASKMTATGASLTSLTSDFELDVNTQEAGLLQLSLASENSIGIDGAIVNLEFMSTNGLSSIDFGSVSLSDSAGRDFETSALQRDLDLMAYQASACVLSGDFDHDGDVDITDVQAVAFRWNTTVGDTHYDALYDLDNDGDIDITDVQTAAFNWNTSCPSAANTATTTQARSANAPQALSLALDPTGVTAASGESFTVELMATGVDNLGGFEFMLNYDPSLIEFTDASLNNSFLGSTGRSFSQIDPDHNLAAGTVSYAAFSLGNNPGPNGDGVLATLTFTMLAEGTSNIEVSSAQVANITGSAQEITQMTGALVNAPPTAVQLAQIGSTEERATRPWLLGLIVGGLVVLLMRRVRKGQLG